jgi:hypothetical protein
MARLYEGQSVLVKPDKADRQMGVTANVPGLVLEVKQERGEKSGRLIWLCRVRAEGWDETTWLPAYKFLPLKSRLP